MEYKAFLAQPKAIEGRSVTGLVAVFGNVDTGGDRIFKGAFKKTIKENGKRVRHLWQHDYTQPPVAAVRELKEVGVDELPDGVAVDYPEVTGGLLVTREYLDTPRGNEILDGIKAGAINEMSFGYDPVKFDLEEMDTPDGKVLVRNLREIRAWDTSDVQWGMNPATVASKMAMLEMMELSLAAAGVNSFLETKAGRVLSARNLAKLQEALSTLNEILSSAEPQDDDEKVLALTEHVLRRLAIAERELYLIGV